MAEIAFTKELVLKLDTKEMTAADVEKTMADHLVSLGYAKDTFPEAILTREQNYPTALFMDGINAAVPHCDIENVNSAAVCVALLSDPVGWYRMDEPDEMAGVRVVCMLALTEAHAHIDMLTRVISFVQDQEGLAKLLDTDDLGLVYQEIQSRLLA